MQQNPCGKCCVDNVIYNEKGGKTKNRGNEKCRNKSRCLYGTLFGSKDGERNKKCEIEKSRVHYTAVL
jgi:hypothetical protein